MQHDINARNNNTGSSAEGLSDENKDREKRDKKGSKKRIILLVIIILILLLLSGFLIFMIRVNRIEKLVKSDAESVESTINESDGMSVADEIRLSVYQGIGSDNMKVFTGKDTDGTVSYILDKADAVLSRNGIELTDDEKQKYTAALSDGTGKLYSAGLIGVYDRDDDKDPDGTTITDLSKAYIANEAVDALIGIKPDEIKQERTDAGMVSFETIIDIEKAMKSYKDSSKSIEDNSKDIDKIAKSLGLDLGSETSTTDIRKMLEAAATAANGSNTKIVYKTDDSSINKLQADYKELKSLVNKNQRLIRINRINSARDLGSLNRICNYIMKNRKYIRTLQKQIKDLQQNGANNGNSGSNGNNGNNGSNGSGSSGSTAGKRSRSSLTR